MEKEFTKPQYNPVPILYFHPSDNNSQYVTYTVRDKSIFLLSPQIILMSLSEVRNLVREVFHILHFYLFALLFRIWESILWHAHHLYWRRFSESLLTDMILYRGGPGAYNALCWRWLVRPNLNLSPLSQVFAIIASMEFVYVEAPQYMKSFAMGIYFGVSALGDLLAVSNQYPQWGPPPENTDIPPHNPHAP